MKNMWTDTQWRQADEEELYQMEIKPEHKRHEYKYRSPKKLKWRCQQVREISLISVYVHYTNNLKHFTQIIIINTSKCISKKKSFEMQFSLMGLPGPRVPRNWSYSDVF
jgi:hypothetical protein